MKPTFAKPWLLALSIALPALAQEEGGGDPEAEVPPSELPASDSPESTASIRTLRTEWHGARKKVQTFLVPLDEKARAATARVAQALEQLQGSLAHYEVVDLGRALKADATPEQARHAAQGRKLLADGNALLASRGYADAAQAYRAALTELEKGLPALDGREYAETWARLGAALALSGDDQAAQRAFVSAARHDPEARIQGRSIDASADSRLASARADVEALPAGALEVESRPAGARVLVDGEPRGQAPVRVDLPSGKHLLRVERAGYFPSAELIEVPAGRELAHTAALKSTPLAAGLYEAMAGAADEAARGDVAANTLKLADKFGLDRMFVGSVASHGAKVSLTLALVDVQKHQQIGKAQLVLAADGTDADQLEEETRTAGRKLAAQDAGEAAATEPQAARAVARPSEEVDLPARNAKVVQPDRNELTKKKRPKKLKEKTGQEGWTDD